jgi:hypothetical protein
VLQACASAPNRPVKTLSLAHFLRLYQPSAQAHSR